MSEAALRSVADVMADLKIVCVCQEAGDQCLFCEAHEIIQEQCRTLEHAQRDLARMRQRIARRFAMEAGRS